MKKTLAVLGLSLFSLGCGSGAANNDQGVGFTLLGFRSEAGGAGSLGTTVGLSEGSQDGGSGAVATFATIQNNLQGQFIRSERAFSSYVIAGAEIQPPPTSQTFAGVVGPANPDTNPGNDSSLPPNFNAPNLIDGQMYVVTPQVREWINLNRNRLPEPPFTMDVQVFVRGVTSSGNYIDTNTASYEVTFVPDLIINPTPPTGTETDGTGTVDEDLVGDPSLGDTDGGSDDGAEVPEDDSDVTDNSPLF